MSDEWAISEIRRDLANIEDMRDARHEATNRHDKDAFSRDMLDLNQEIKALRLAYDVSFADWLRLLVETSGLSQRAFAEKIGVPLRTLENWIAGTRTPQELVQTSVYALYQEIMNGKYH